MLKRIELLPNWAITNKKPAFYDTESKTVIEETALLYAKMQDLVIDYNSFVDEVNTKIIEFINSTETSIEEFEVGLRQEFQDFIDVIDLKVKEQDKDVAEAVKFMKDNISKSVTEVIAQMHESGEFDEAVLNAINNIGDRVSNLERTEYTLEYVEGTENLILVKTVKEGE